MDWVRGETLGRGSFGKVSLAVPRSLGIAGASPPMVVKSCGVSCFDSLMNEKAVLDELRGCREVIQCFGDCYSFENGEKLYNVLLEFASQGALADKVKNSENRRLSEMEIRKYSKALLRGLGCPFDFPDWVSESSSITSLPRPESEYSPADRLRGIVSHQSPNWSQDSDEWVNVR
nr:mitogen-activated protein kinase kinase kinase 1-like [Ipomoea trifida]